MKRDFVIDLNDAAEAWFAYADQHFGESVLIQSTRYPGKQEWIRPHYEPGDEEHGHSHGAFLDGFLHARGWRQHERESDGILEYYWPETSSMHVRGAGGL